MDLNKGDDSVSFMKAVKHMANRPNFINSSPTCSPSTASVCESITSKFASLRSTCTQSNSRSIVPSVYGKQVLGRHALSAPAAAPSGASQLINVCGGSCAVKLVIFENERLGLILTEVPRNSVYFCIIS